MSSSNSIIRLVGEELSTYFNKTRFEESFDSSSPGFPRRSHPPPIKKTLINVPGIHDRPVQHYFSHPELRIFLTQFNDLEDSVNRRAVVRRIIDYYIKRFNHKSFAHHNKYCSRPGYYIKCSRNPQFTMALASLQTTMNNLRKAAHGPSASAKSPKKRLFKVNCYDPVLTGTPHPIIGKGQAERLVNMAVKMLACAEKINLVDSKYLTTSPGCKLQPLNHKFLDTSPRKITVNNIDKFIPNRRVPQHQSDDTSSRWENTPTTGVGHFVVKSRRQENPLPPETKTVVRISKGSIENLETEVDEVSSPTTPQNETDTANDFMKRFMAGNIAGNRATTSDDSSNSNRHHGTNVSASPHRRGKTPVDPRGFIRGNESRSQKRRPPQHMTDEDSDSKPLPLWLIKELEIVAAEERRVKRATTPSLKKVSPSASKHRKSPSSSHKRSTQSFPQPHRHVTEDQLTSPDSSSKRRSKSREKEDGKMHPPSVNPNEQPLFVSYHTPHPPSVGTESRRKRCVEGRKMEENGTKEVFDGRYRTIDTQTDRHLLAQYKQSEDVLSEGESDPCIYQVVVETGKCLGASTRARIYLALSGPLGRSREVALESSHTHKIPFKKGHSDYFSFTCPYVGPIDIIQIGHESRETASNWFLDSVSIIDPRSKQRLYFSCQRWLGVSSPTGATKALLQPISVVDITQDPDQSLDQPLDHSDSSAKRPSKCSDDPPLEEGKATKEPHKTPGSQDHDCSDSRKEELRSSKGRDPDKKKPHIITKETPRMIDPADDSISDNDSTAALVSKRSLDSMDEPPQKAMTSEEEEEVESDDVTDAASIIDSSDEDNGEPKASPDHDSTSEGSEKGASPIESQPERAPKMRKTNSNNNAMPPQSPSKPPQSSSKPPQSSSKPPLKDDQWSTCQNSPKSQSSDKLKKKGENEKRHKPKKDDPEEAHIEDENTPHIIDMDKVPSSDESPQQSQKDKPSTSKQGSKSDKVLPQITIHDAVAQNNSAVVDQLIEADDSVIRLPDGEGLLPLHVACEWGHPDMVTRLWRAGANISQETPEGYLPVHLCALDDHAECLGALLATGEADVEAPDLMMGMTPLHLAALSGHLNVVRMLLESNLNLDPEMPTADGQTALELAKSREQVEVVQYLEHLIPSERSSELVRPSSQLDSQRQPTPLNENRPETVQEKEKMLLYTSLFEENKTPKEKEKPTQNKTGLKT